MNDAKQQIATCLPRHGRPCNAVIFVTHVPPKSQGVQKQNCIIFCAADSSTFDFGYLCVLCLDCHVTAEIAIFCSDSFTILGQCLGITKQTIRATSVPLRDALTSRCTLKIPSCWTTLGRTCVHVLDMARNAYGSLKHMMGTIVVSQKLCLRSFVFTSFPAGTQKEETNLSLQLNFI